MNWDAIGAIGELLSALVVFASVIYLAVQVRENTRVSKNEAYRETAETWNGVFRMLLEADNQVVLKALASYETLESGEKFHFDALMTALLNTVEISIEVMGEHFAVDDSMGSIEEYVGHYFSYPGTFEWWRRSKRGMAPKVQEWIDRRFPGPDPQSDYWGITSPASPD